tara:strand:+ start:102315 stop:102932 length:618 start_codon:yes stop_codon:yes gene_type:complete
MLNIDPYLKSLKKNKIVVIPDFLNEEEINSVRSEYEAILEDRAKPYGFGRAVRLYGIPDDLVAIKEIFNSKEMLVAARHFYGRTPFKFNTAVFLSHEFGIPGDAPNGYWHSDRDHAFKFMIYLKDVGPHDGPFSYIPNSANIGAKLRLSRKHQLRDHPDLLKLVNKEETVLAKAGTLMIFSTDVIHKGGRINGGERMVIRGHCRP